MKLIISSCNLLFHTVSYGKYKLQTYSFIILAVDKIVTVVKVKADNFSVNAYSNNKFSF